MPELELLRRLAPPETPPSDEAREAARAALLARAGRRRRPWLIAVPTVAAAAAAAIVFLGSDHTAPAAATVLRRAAAAARQVAPSRPLGPGQYIYTHSRDAFLSTVGDRHPFSTLVPHDRETWLSRDGTGWLISRAGKPVWLSERDRRNWIASGRPNLDEGTMDLALANSDGDTPPMESLSLPDDPNALWSRLEATAGGSKNALHAEMFTLVGDALRETYTTPKQRAALYEVAARLPGVKLVGATTDPIGRRGVAVEMDDHARRTTQRLIFDPRTGAMLGEEDRLLAGNWMHLPAGTRIGWAAYLRQEVVDHLKERP